MMERGSTSIQDQDLPDASYELPSFSYPPPTETHLMKEYESRRASKLPPRDQIRKAGEVLGVNFTDAKLMDTLGVDEPTLQQAKENVQEQRDKSEMLKKMRLPSDKTGLKKALKVLGEDPSRKKVMDKLGIDEVQLSDVEKEMNELLWENVAREGARTTFHTHTASKKALAVLGFDPTAEKLRKLYGIEEEDIIAAREQSIDALRQQPSNRYIPDKQSNKKALQVLGVDPTREKLRTLYGMDDQELDNAEAERRRLEEEKIQKESKKTHVPDRTSTRKACSVLGIAPSEEKMMATFGLNKQGLEEAMDELDRSRTENFIQNQKKLLAAQGKRPSEKAMNVLGFNPSLHKAMEKLGISEDELHSSHIHHFELDESASVSELNPLAALDDDSPVNDAKRKHIADRTQANQKAFAVLGIDTKERLATKLGFTSSEELRQAELEAQRSVSPPISPSSTSPNSPSSTSPNSPTRSRP